MAVVYVGEDWKGRGGRIGDDGVGTFKRVFSIRTDNKYDGPITVLADPRIPRLFDGHPENPTMFTCRSVVPECSSEMPTLWKVDCEYNNQFNRREEEKKQGEVTNPVNFPAEFDWDGVAYRELLIDDIHGEPVLNAAGDPPDPPIEIDATYEAVHIEKNMNAPPRWIFKLSHRINSDRFLLDGVPVEPQQAKISKIRVGRKIRESDGKGGNFPPFRKVTMEIHIKPEGKTWKIKFLNRGFYELVDEEKSGKTVKVRRLIKDDKGNDISSPVLLHPDGRKLSTEFIQQIGSGFKGFYRQVDGYQTVAFSQFIPR